MTNCKTFLGNQEIHDSEKTQMVSPQTRNKKHGHLTLIEHHYGCRDCENVRSDVWSPKLQDFPLLSGNVESVIAFTLGLQVSVGSVTCLRCSNLILFKDKETGKLLLQILVFGSWGGGSLGASVKIWVQIPSAQVKSLLWQCLPVTPELGAEHRRIRRAHWPVLGSGRDPA